MQRAQLVSLIVAVVGLVVIILAGVLGWVVVPNIIDDQIIEQVQLVNGSETWDKWADIPLPIHLKFNIIHIKNPDAVENGAIPEVSEHGPYSYREKRLKVNMSQDEGDDLLKYSQTITYFYDEAASCSTCKDSDTYNVINIALISVLDGIADLAGAGLAALIANSVLGTEKVILRGVSVGDLIFNGFDVRLYTETLGPLLPVEFSGGRFGLYKGENGSSDGEYEIYTGVANTKDFGIIKTWDGKTYLNEWWKPNSPCAMINGTDGSIFAPFVEKSRILDIFTTDLCRSIYLVFEKEIEFMGIKGYRFVAPPEMLEDPRINVANQCFCLEEKLEDCPKAGVLPVKSCRGAPIMMSTPHFLDGTDSYYKEAGQTPPVKELHETYIDLEPHTGVNLRASKKIQVNVELKKLAGVKAMANIRNYTIFPLLWANEEANFDEANADDLKQQLLTPLKIVLISKWTVLAVGCVLFGVGAAMFFVYYKRSTRTV